MKRDGGWKHLTAEQREARIAKMVRARKANARTRQQVQLVTHELPAPVVVDAAPVRSLDDLAGLIVAVWRHLERR